jgi:hypothetical protein
MQWYGGTLHKNNQTRIHGYGRYQHTRLGFTPTKNIFLDIDVASKPTQNILLSWCLLVVCQDSPLITVLVVCVMCLMNKTYDS